MRSWSELLHCFKVSAICIWCRKWMKDCTVIAIALKVFIYNPLAMKMCLWLKKWSMSHEALCSSSRKVPWHTMTFELSWKLSTKFFQVHLEFHQSSPPYHPLTIPGSLGARALGSRSRMWASRARSLGSEFPAPAARCESKKGTPKLVTLLITKCRSML